MIVFWLLRKQPNQNFNKPKSNQTKSFEARRQAREDLEERAANEANEEEIPSSGQRIWENLKHVDNRIQRSQFSSVFNTQLL